MIPTGIGLYPVQELSHAAAAAFVGEAINIANPTHANTLALIGQVLSMDVTSGATGRKVTLAAGDECVVAELENSFKLPRDTRQYTDAEVASAGPLRFRRYEAYAPSARCDVSGAEI